MPIMTAQTKPAQISLTVYSCELPRLKVKQTRPCEATGPIYLCPSLTGGSPDQSISLTAWPELAKPSRA